MTQGRFVRSASLLPDGNILVVTSDSTAAGGQAGAAIYDPAP